MNRIISSLLIISFTFLLTSTGNALFISDKTKTKLTKKQKEFLKKQEELNQYYSDKKLGSFVQDGKTYFRLFTPNAENVVLILFDKVDEDEGKEHKMKRDEDGVWETILDGELYGKFYGYKVFHKNDPASGEVLCIDPYTKAVATYNTYFNPRKSIVVEENTYNWEGDEWIKKDWRDLIIYEIHIRDMTEHPSSGVEQRGTYKGLIEKGKRGGIDYIKELGVNAVELLPAQEFANIEIPFKDSLFGKFNTWNPYGRNHWGYMTAAYFAPESYYSNDVRNIEWNKWSGADAKAVTDFKDIVKAFHKEGIAVIMDVVYNHLSEYELGNLKQIDKEYYFRLDEKGNFIAESYCGNDLKTERPMMRRLIVESILYWMKEYHVDGFRFDLGKLIDWETIEEIIYEAKKINSHVVFVCEPWGGGYDPQGFSLRGWGSWNDQIRNGIKGENPVNGHGWIFGKWYGNNDPNRIKSYVNGTLIHDKLGLFQKPAHAINYLESHDGYTFGDFIRIGLDEKLKDKVIDNTDKFVKLNDEQLKLNKLGALFLLTSRGVTMLHSGQEFARTKTIPKNIEVPDSHKGQIDHNSYDKDNETNYINYEHAEINKELFDYYKGLIEIRKKYSAFRRAEYSEVEFYPLSTNPFALAYKVKHNDEEFVVLMNADRNIEEEFALPKGKWKVIVDPNTAGTEILSTAENKLSVPPSSGFVLMR